MDGKRGAAVVNNIYTKKSLQVVGGNSLQLMKSFEKKSVGEEDVANGIAIKRLLYLNI